MIISFSCRETKKLFERQRIKRFQSFERVALRKLHYLDNAISLDDLKSPPGNRLEALSGDRNGQFSIRINNKWRVCFYWDNGNAYQVEIADYH
ncbi:MAG: type II toxin-antitoxin system RelE/ParE family toxin [Bdellovibrionota bacterium]